MTECRRLRFDDPADFRQWQDYVDGRPDAHCADLAQWRLLFADLYGIENYSYACFEQGRVTGALSLYHVRSPFTGNLLLTAPFFGTGGVFWDSDAARTALLERARDTAAEVGAHGVELRLLHELPEPFRSNTDFAEFTLTPASSVEETWERRLASNVRQNVRKSRGNDLSFRLSRDHGPCYDLLRRTLRAHGTPFHGKRFFELLDTHLGDRVRYSEVRHRSGLVAGGVVIRFKDSIITPYIGSLASSRSLRSNYLQYWGLIEHCLAEGIARFDMGRSPRGSTHARFKKKWGCTERPAFYGYWMVDPTRRYRSVSRPTRLQVLAAAVWRKLPLGLTTALGPRLFRYVP